ncbi:MAG TPA: ATP-grasp domain-containing protein [Gemmataceae bacterium]|nr:ATP-grasp domain-containing protein [Gemmataceae bacterium]
MQRPDLLIVGASARAAAFSALRAGLRPWCVDLFADRDLQQRCVVTRLTRNYPEGFRRFIESDLPSPWMYTGGLENRPRLVERWSQYRPLWGNAETALSRCRDPKCVTSLLRSAGMPAPAVVDAVEKSAATQRWLLKPRRGAGGSGIRYCTPMDDSWDNNDVYCQEFIEGQALSLLFLGGARSARLIGITRQLVGETWLHAAPFHYCGSIGPLDPGLVQRPSLEELGRLLASECFLEGLFGVDGGLREGTFWPVEVNPRYTASVEVLEHATESPMLGWHAYVFTHRCLPPPPPTAVPGDRTIGKAILFARDDLHFPADGPWMAELRSPKPVEELPNFADIPAAGEHIEAGKPILTFFAAADSPSACEERLRQIAADLDRWLFER